MNNNINKLLSLNEDFNFSDFSKKVSNKDIVKIIKENNNQNYIIEKFDRKVIFSNLFDTTINPYNFNKIESVQYKNKIYYSDDFDNLLFEPNEEIRINLKDDITDYSGAFSNINCYYLNLSHFNTSKVTDMSYMFACCEYLEELDLSSFNTSNVINMSFMFFNCTGLKSINLNSFNTSKVTDMSNMFYNCEGLKKLDLSSFNTSNVTNMSNMFANCKDLKELDLSFFNTSKVINMCLMFYNCRKLKKLDLSSFVFSKTINTLEMFYGCKSLANLKLDFLKLNTILDNATKSNMFMDAYANFYWYLQNQKTN